MITTRDLIKYLIELCILTILAVTILMLPDDHMFWFWVKVIAIVILCIISAFIYSNEECILAHRLEPEDKDEDEVSSGKEIDINAGSTSYKW